MPGEARHSLASGALLVLVVAIGSASGAEIPLHDPVGVRFTGPVFAGQRTSHFEIVMEGYGRYYRREWSDPPETASRPKRGSWGISLVIDDFEGAMGEGWDERGKRGGGGHVLTAGKYHGEVGRRLW